MILKIKPVLREKKWGGEKLREIFPEKKINKNIGEAWVVSGYSNNESIIEEQNETLGTFYKKHKDLFDNYPSEEFPLLIKLFDAAHDLSVQVHPNNEQAQRMENSPLGNQKCWYVLDNYGADQIILGTKINDLERIKKLVDQEKWLDIFKYQIIKPNKVLDIAPGTLHAISGGIFLYELQQPSNIAYHFFDYEQDEKLENEYKLNREKALKVLNPFAHSHISEETFVEGDNLISKIVSNKVFSLRKIVLKNKLKLNLHKKDYHFLVITCINGIGTINGKEFKSYESFIVTSDELSHVRLKGDATLLVANPN